MSNFNNSSLISSCVQSQTKITKASNSPGQHVAVVTDDGGKSRGAQKPINLRSPIAKRPPNGQITLQGWLHKQGSDGLQLWRRRWFVLSELCLYYYKNTEEERLLGSVLLPSYQVSECQASEKIRKFAFKLEHTNMRTYILAAESHKAMVQWLCALKLACMPQIGTKLEMKNLQQNVPFVPNQYGGRQYPQPQTTPDIFQPLYENAPPKPRRVSEPTRYSDPYYVEYANHQQQQPQKYSHIIYANNESTTNPRIYRSSAPPSSSQLHQLPNTERRTPDTYARSNYDPRLKFPADYEDVYNIQNELYRPPNSPAAHNYIRNDVPPIIFRNSNQYANNYKKPFNIEPTSRTTIYFPENYKPNREIISRPHSVDFLEHSNENDIVYKQPERPKSSLDINQRVSSNENYFYSEQDYANKMRQSALYLQLHSTNASEYLRTRPQQIANEVEMARNRQNRFYDNQVQVQHGQQPAPQQEVGLNNRISRTMPKMSSSSANMNSGNMTPTSRPASRSPQTLPNPRSHLNRESSDKKREESMKRLIEWKQRMLQSPLNHKQMSRRLNEQNKNKHSTSTQPVQFSPTINCPIDSANSATSSIASSQSHYGKVSNLHSSAGQSNSYSSDDEDTERSGSVDVNNRNRQSINVVDEISIPDWDNSTEMGNSKPEPTSSSCSSPFKDVEDSAKTSVKSSETLTLNTNIEEHYMIMTSKKAVLAPTMSARGAIFDSLLYESEESSYVEMMQGMGMCLLDDGTTNGTNRDVQPYETVCFGNDKIEPVYMELGQGENPPTTFPNTQSYHTLPDILITAEKQKSSKSDSSDADDEASKDFDSLDTPSQPRFSLSDTFRPASYYLGVNRVLAEFHDSSDSELVSPPPIPDANTLLDDLDMQNTNDDTNVTIGSPKVEFASNKRRPLSTEFHFKLEPLHLRKTENGSSRESLSTPTGVYDESNDHHYENMYVINEARDNLNSSSNTLTSSASESTFVAKDILNETFSLPASPCSSNLINTSQNSFDISNNISIQLLASHNTHLSTSPVNTASIVSELKNSHRSITPQNSDMILSQLSRDYYLDLLRSSNNSDTSTSTKNISLNNETLSDSKLDKQLRKADMFQMALSAKSDSIDIIKFRKINNKNIYHDEDQIKSNFPEDKNWYKSKEINCDESNQKTVRRSYSLEGLLQNVFKENRNEKSLKNINMESANEVLNESDQINEGNHLWEEDCVWQENLRRASHRHARSLDDLQVTKAETATTDSQTVSKSTTPKIKLTRGVTYVNDCIATTTAATKISNNSVSNKDDVYVHLSMDRSKYSNTDKSFIIDREKLRQWDLMSSAPVLSRSHRHQGSTAVHAHQQTATATKPGVVYSSNSTSNDEKDDKLINDIENEEKLEKNSASGSVSVVSGHDGQSLDHYQWTLPLHSNYLSHQISQNDRSQFRTGSLPGVHSANATNKKRQISQPKTSDSRVESINRKDFKLSAGELLGRTHEELVLLLIQLRRESISTYQAIEACYSEIDSIKMLINQSDGKQKLAHSQRLEYLKLQLLDLGKQYEKSKPLVNLVDNMVKLGSFYQQNHSNKLNDSRNRERIQFNQYVQERRLLAEERRDWEKLNLNQTQLQNKIQQLYELDNALRYESGTLVDLRREKEYLEQALFNLQSRLNDPDMPSTSPAELDRVRHHQQLLERELSRKLEETVAGNARIEQELLVLRQKLQERQRQKNNSYISNTLPKERKSLVDNGEMEGELRRVQWLVGDLQKQRQELSVQVQNLTDKSHNLAQQMQWPMSSDSSNFSNDLSSYKSNFLAFPTNLKRNQSSWLETDLDQCITNEYSKTSMPLINHQSDDSTSTLGVFSTDTSDTQQSNGNLHEKQEIKTVRIVKRESERRQRDRERTTGPGSALTLPVSSYRMPMVTSSSSTSLKRDYEYTNDINYLYLDETNENQISNQTFYPDSNSVPLPSSVRRTIPKEKRRHHTAPDNTHISRELSLISTNEKENANGLWKKDERRDRSLDDLDMERALRPRNNAPDVVRSTLGHKEVKYNEGTIDSVLGTPSKIIIPERYMPQDLPQLTAEEEQHRLRKVESIKKMLTDSATLNAFSDEKRQREHLLHLNQILAKQVIEMSKIVAENALKNLPQGSQVQFEEDDLSPVTPLPLYQQRENYFT